MKKRYLFLAVVCLSVLCFCSSVLASEIKVGLTTNPDPNDPAYGFAMVFKNYVESASNGKMLVSLFPSNMLGKERERLELTRAGAITVNVGSLGGLSLIYKPAILLNTPFMYSSDKQVYKVMESDFVKWMFEDMRQKTGIHSAAVIQMGGLSCLTNNVRPIEKLEDMKGIKFRAMDDSQVNMFKALGANAVPMAWAEVYTGLQTGVVDGQVNPLSVIRNYKIFEVQKYLTLSRTILGAQWVSMNDAWYKGLSDEERTIVDDAVYYGDLAARGLSQLSQALDLNELRNAGIIVSSLPNEEYKKFRDIARKSSLEWAKSKMDPDIVDRFVAACDE